MQYGHTYGILDTEKGIRNDLFNYSPHTAQRDGRKRWDVMRMRGNTWPLLLRHECRCRKREAILLDESMILCVDPERQHVQGVEQLHAHDRHQTVIEHSTTSGHRAGSTPCICTTQLKVHNVQHTRTVVRLAEEAVTHSLCGYCTLVQHAMRGSAG